MIGLLVIYTNIAITTGGKYVLRFYHESVMILSKSRGGLEAQQEVDYNLKSTSKSFRVRAHPSATTCAISLLSPEVLDEDKFQSEKKCSTVLRS